MKNSVDKGTKAMVRFISDEGIQEIHASTLTALNETGVFIHHEKGLQLLADAGASVDFKSKNAKIPPDLVEDCLAKAPQTFTLAGRDPAQDLELKYDGDLYARNGGGPGHVVDLDTGIVRPATTTDVVDYARLVDYTSNINIVAPIYTQETEPRIRDIHTLALMFANTTKHINMRLLSLNSLPYVLKMAEIVAGDKQRLKQRPIITMLESPIAPLKLPDVLVETLFACAEYGIPVEICSMPITGATGPITLAGSLLMSNIEMVASIVVLELVQPGSPIIFTPRIMVMDMASAFAMTGSIENALLAAAGVQLAREAYHLPVNMHGPYTDSMLCDVQAGMENAYFSFLPAFAGANILTGAGHLNGGIVVNFRQLLVDNELMGIVKRAKQGFEVNQETLGLDAISRSPLEGNLLTDPHTMKHLRSLPRYKPSFQIREQRENWVDKGSVNMEGLAEIETRRILESYQAEPLPPEVSKALDEVIEQAKKELPG